VPLDPGNLTPEASLNRVRLVSGRRLALPPQIEGRTAGDLLSAAAVEGLGLQGQAERLAYLIATLKLGEPEARAARPEWDESYWRHWRGIERVYLAGGRASGALAEAVDRILRGPEVDCEVLLAPHPVGAPLIGAARSLAVDSETAYAFDFGGTAVKRGVVRFERGILISLRMLESLPSPQQSGDRSPGTIAAIVAGTIDATGDGPVTRTQVGVSIASYVRDDHPLDPPHAGYVALHGITNLGRWLETELWRRTGAEVTLRLLHDGTAAALSVSPAASSAVITLGTYLGIGFARSAAGRLAPLSTRFVVSEFG
jgi:hypothetical protein